jgi:hemerythrin-like metal-binding protein
MALISALDVGSLDVVTVLDAFAPLARRHFEAEETLMERVQYPLRRPHGIEHRALLHCVAALQHEAHAGSTGVELEARLFLRRWLDDHHKHVDARLHQHLAHLVRRLKPAAAAEGPVLAP